MKFSTAKLTDEQIRAIRSRYRDGATKVSLQREFKIPRGTLQLVLNASVKGANLRGRE